MDDTREDRILREISHLRDRMTREFIATIIVIVLWQLVITLIVVSK